MSLCSRISVRLQFVREFSSTRRNVRVRFAPSPTGEMHLGGLRTALYNFLFARKHLGQFILRIEDTDRTRLVPGAQERIIETLEWAGLKPDEGPGKLGGGKGPYIQSERLHHYKEFVDKLIQKGAAYRCFCTERRLGLMKKSALSQKTAPKYDQRCKNLSSQEIRDLMAKDTPFVVRFELKPGQMQFRDVVYGDVSLDISQTEGDFIILKSDGYPTYHFANIVDDHLMEISHVLRGVEWQISTPKHLQMFKALGLTPPEYAHLPLMLNFEDGTKLSKRHKGFMCDQLRGVYLPQAVVNFLLLSGGGMGQITGNFYKMDEIIQKFNVEHISTHSCKVDFKRLDEVNPLAIRGLAAEIVDDAFEIVSKRYPAIKKDYFKNVFYENLDRLTKLEDLIGPSLEFLWTEPKVDEKLPDGWEEPFKNLLDGLKNHSFEEKALSEFLREFHKRELNHAPFKELMSTLRRLLSGLKEGPGVSKMMISLGKDRTVERLSRFVK